MSEDKIHVLYVDDEEHNLITFKANFRRIYNVYTAISAAEGRKILEEQDIHVLITDQRMPEMTGVEFLESIIDEYPDPIRILLTGFADIEVVIDAINMGEVYRYITKPWNETDLKIAIENAYEIHALRKENKELIDKLIKANDQLEFMLRQQMLS